MHPVDTKEIFIFKNLFKGNRKLYRKGPIFPQNENYSKTKLENNIFFSSSPGTSVALRSKKKYYSLLYYPTPFPPRHEKPEMFHSGLQSIEMGFLGPVRKMKGLSWKKQIKTIFYKGRKFCGG